MLLKAGILYENPEESLGFQLTLGLTHNLEVAGSNPVPAICSPPFQTIRSPRVNDPSPDDLSGLFRWNASYRKYLRVGGSL